MRSDGGVAPYGEMKEKTPTEVEAFSLYLFEDTPNLGLSLCDKPKFES